MVLTAKDQKHPPSSGEGSKVKRGLISEEDKVLSAEAGGWMDALCSSPSGPAKFMCTDP